jgi:hypothetical protein
LVDELNQTKEAIVMLDNIKIGERIALLRTETTSPRDLSATIYHYDQ